DESFGLPLCWSAQSGASKCLNSDGTKSPLRRSLARRRRDAQILGPDVSPAGNCLGGLSAFREARYAMEFTTPPSTRGACGFLPRSGTNQLYFCKCGNSSVSRLPG